MNAAESMQLEAYHLADLRNGEVISDAYRMSEEDTISTTFLRERQEELQLEYNCIESEIHKLDDKGFGADWYYDFHYMTPSDLTLYNISIDELIARWRKYLKDLEPLLLWYEARLNERR